MIGIYKITNQINNKVYIGQSLNIEKRWSDHRTRPFRECIDYDKPLYRAIRKYGLDNFLFEVLEECTPEELDDKEIYYIKKFEATDKDKGYNIALGGYQGSHYDYFQIYQLWQSGKQCKEIQDIMGCSDGVVTKALRTYNIKEADTKSIIQNKKAYVALSVNKEPLKIFDSMASVYKFFLKQEGKTGNFYDRAILKRYRVYGYYWECLNETNVPKKELSDEEFLKYQCLSPYANDFSEERKMTLSFLKRTVERPNRQELKKLIRKYPFTKIGEMYGVSDNAVRKWCDFEKLPRKKREINAYSDEEWEKI